MFPTCRSTKKANIPIRSAILCGITCVSLVLGACDITGDAYRNGPIKLPSSKDGKMKDEVSRMDSSGSSTSRGSVGDLNPKNLFGKNLDSDARRIDRLERAMQDLRNEFDSVKPSVDRLMVIEGDIQNLVGELRRLSNQPKMPTNNPPPAKQMDAAPAPQVMQPKAKAPSKPVKRKTPPPVSDGTMVYDVRIGEHPGKTRVVLDTNAKTSFSIDIDNNEKIMIVDLPQAKWSAAQSKNLSSKRLGSYRVEDSESGSLLIFQLKGNTEVMSQNEIPGTGGAGRRIVIDLK